MIESIIAAYFAISVLVLLFVAPYRTLLFEKVITSARNTNWLMAAGLSIIISVFWCISFPLLKRQAKHDAFNKLMLALDYQDQNIHYPDKGYRESKRGVRYDPAEDEPEFQAVIDEVRAEAHRRLELHPWRNKMGYGHVFKKTLKLILREEHGINWRTSVEMNPHICYD